MPDEKNGSGLPYRSAPMAEGFSGALDSCFAAVNKYGTYEVQDTADTENIFPMIAHGLPVSWKGVHIDRPEIKRNTSE